MAQKTTVEFEGGVPGLAKAKVSRTSSSTKTTFCYSCKGHFYSQDDARKFREMVEKAIAECRGEMAESHLDIIKREGTG